MSELGTTSWKWLELYLAFGLFASAAVLVSVFVTADLLAYRAVKAGRTREDFLGRSPGVFRVFGMGVLMTPGALSVALAQRLPGDPTGGIALAAFLGRLAPPA